MRIYGWQGGLHIEPESESEGELLRQVIELFGEGKFVYGPAPDSVLSNDRSDYLTDEEIAARGEEFPECIVQRI